MGRAAGQLILGTIGAIIAGPIGFTIGSAIGGIIFAPDQPNNEGPRIGDTTVSASSLGKTIAEHYGVTRASGNMIWSAGLREKKTTEEQGGKGGGGPTTTTYTYFASFAFAMGRGPASTVLRIWADSKIIYDITGDGDVQNDKYKFRFINGTADQEIDPLISESINRRLAGLDDVSAGNQDPATYTTLTEIVTELDAADDPRSAIYASQLRDRLVEQAELYEVTQITGLTDEEKENMPLGQFFSVFFRNEVRNVTQVVVPDFRMTPAYRNECIILFDDMPLADFGNRIPNITAEIAWAGGDLDLANDPNEINPALVQETEVSLTAPLAPTGLTAVDLRLQRLFVTDGTQFVRLTSSGSGETMRTTPNPSITDFKTLGVAPDGKVIVHKTDTGPGYVDNLWMLSGDSLRRAGSYVEPSAIDDGDPDPDEVRGEAMNALIGTPLYGTPVINGGTQNRSLFAIANNRNEIHIVDTSTDRLTHVWGHASAATISGSASLTEVLHDRFPGESASVLSARFTTEQPTAVGPMCRGGSGDQKAWCYMVANTGDGKWGLFRIEAQYTANAGAQSDSSIFSGGEASTGQPQFAATIVKTREGPLNGGDVATVMYDNATGTAYVGINEGDGTAKLYRIDEDAEAVRFVIGRGLNEEGGNPIFSYEDLKTKYDWIATLPYHLPLAGAGMDSTWIMNQRFAYAANDDLISVDLLDGAVERTIWSHTIFNDFNNTTGGINEDVYFKDDVLSGPVSPEGQIYLGRNDQILTWISGTMVLISLGRANADSFLALNPISKVIASICTRAGMSPDEFDVSGLDAQYVHGYSVARNATGRQALEKLLMPYFIDGVETDWTVKFIDRKTDPVRTIPENELGAIRSDTGDVNWLEQREPEYDLPAEINLTYLDRNLDYQKGTAHYRRVANPVSSMDSRTIENIELPLVMLEPDARDVTQRLMFLSWMSRDQSKAKLPWRHIDLDPSDVIRVAFNDGRTVTDRLSKTELGANFEIETQASRSGDPVYVSAPHATLASSSIPSRTIRTVANSFLFLLDIPLLADYHDTGRSASRYYTAVGADSALWTSAGLFRSIDDGSYSQFDSTNTSVTWGEVTSPIPAPRALWATDKETQITVALSVDRGDIVSVTRDEILNARANYAVLYNPVTNVSEIIQYQNVTENADGTVTLTNLLRGLRGTDTAVTRHTSGTKFIRLTDATVGSHTQDLGVLGVEQYFRAVSQGALLTSAPTKSRAFSGADLKPYAPSRVNREDAGSDLDLSWNRRTRIGGEWNMTATGSENLPLNEDSEEYEVFLVNSGVSRTTFSPTNPATFEASYTVTSPTLTISAADISAAGYTGLDDTITVALYQVSAQVGRGFGRFISLAP